MSKIPLDGPLFDVVQQALPQHLRNLVNTAQDLSQPAGSGEYVALQASDQKLELKDGQVELFDQPFVVSGSLAADLLVHAPEAQVSILAFLDPKTKTPVFDEAETLTAPQDQVLSELRLQAAAKIEGSFKPPNTGALSLSANLAGGGGLVYRHLRPGPATGTTRFDALTKLLTSSRPPALVSLDEVAESELHALESLVHLDFGLSAELGGDFDVKTDLAEVIDVFDGMSAELQVHVVYSLQASLGFSLYQQMQLAIGRFNVTRDEWLRLRIQRLHRRELTLGAKLSLQANYDMAQRTFTALLDRILELDPTTELMSVLEDVQQLRADGGWDAVRARLQQAVGSEVDEFLQDDVWRRWISDRDRAEIDDFLNDLQEIVTAYDDLPEKIRSLWDALLASADLGPDSRILAALRQIAAIDPEQPSAVLEEVLGDDWAPAIELLEVLAGRSLDDLLVGQKHDVATALRTGQKLAATAVEFIDGLPDRAIALIQQFAERTGIEGTVAWLRQNATSLETLQQTLVNERIQRLVSRLLGKAWDTIDQDDLDRLGGWLDRIENVLQVKQTWEERIRGIIDRFEGELGFSLSLEISRLTESSALLDLEFDPTSSAVVRAVDQARTRGNARALLERLPQADTMEQAGFRVRDAVFSSRRVRTSALSFIFSLFGTLQRRRQTTRTDEETIRVTQDGGSLVRQGSYSGGVVQALAASGGRALANKRELGVWLTLRAMGGGGDLSASYDQGLQAQELRVTFSREDDDTDPEELQALDQLLFDLGFLLPGSQRVASLSQNPIITDFTVDLRFPEKAVAALFSTLDEPGWNADYLNACHRWLDETLVPGKFKPTRDRDGRVLPAILERRDFQQHWLDGADFLANFPQEELRVDVDGKTVSVPQVSTRTDRGVHVFRLAGIGDLVFSRKNGLDGLGRARQIYTDLAETNPDPQALRRLAARFSTAMANTAFKPGGGPDVVFEQWPSPLFNLWLILARLCRIDRSAIAGAKGLAVLRFKAKAEDDWQGPLRWQLSGDLPIHAGPRSIFPFPPPAAAVAESLATAADPTVASRDSDIFHLSSDCASARRIMASKRVVGAAARRGRTLHVDCSRS